MTTSADPAALLRGRAYLRLLLFAALLGVPVSAAVYGFLALAHYLQEVVYIHLPRELGFATAPLWWPLPMLLVGAVLAALAIRFLPGHGGPTSALGFKLHSPPEPAELPGAILAALATLAFGVVLGPEMPSILIGGGLVVLVIRLTRLNLPDRAVRVLSASGSFAGVNALLGNPLVGAFLLMEASGLGGPTLIMMLLPGLLAAGVGTLIFIGLNSWTGLGVFSLAIPGLPHVGGITVGEFGWAVVIGVAAVPVGVGIQWLGRFVYQHAVRRTLLLLPLAGLVVGGLAVLYSGVTGQPSGDVLFSGQTALPHLINHASGYTVGTLLLVLVCKGLAYGVSLGGFRGGPVFPALFVGAAGGVAMSHLPGLPVVAAVAMGMGALSVVVLSLPLTSVLLACLLLASDGIVVMPLVIVSVTVAYVVAARLTPRAEPDDGGPA